MTDLGNVAADTGVEGIRQDDEAEEEVVQRVNADMAGQVVPVVAVAGDVGGRSYS